MVDSESVLVTGSSLAAAVPAAALSQIAAISYAGHGTSGPDALS